MSVPRCLESADDGRRSGRLHHSLSIFGETACVVTAVISQGLG